MVNFCWVGESPIQSPVPTLDETLKILDSIFANKNIIRYWYLAYLKNIKQNFAKIENWTQF